MKHDPEKEKWDEVPNYEDGEPLGWRFDSWKTTAVLALVGLVSLIGLFVLASLG